MLSIVQHIIHSIYKHTYIYVYMAYIKNLLLTYTYLYRYRYIKYLYSPYCTDSIPNHPFMCKTFSSTLSQIPKMFTQPNTSENTEIPELGRSRQVNPGLKPSLCYKASSKSKWATLVLLVSQKLTNTITTRLAGNVISSFSFLCLLAWLPFFVSNKEHRFFINWISQKTWHLRKQDAILTTEGLKGRKPRSSVCSSIIRASHSEEGHQQLFSWLSPFPGPERRPQLRPQHTPGASPFATALPGHCGPDGPLFSKLFSVSQEAMTFMRRGQSNTFQRWLNGANFCLTKGG